MGVPLPTGPGTVAPGQWVTCLPGSLPAREGGRGGGTLVSVGPKTSLVDTNTCGRRRIPNDLLHPEAGPSVDAWRRSRGYRTTHPGRRGWLPSWQWLEWTIADHLDYTAGRRTLPQPPPPPQRLIIVTCGTRKLNCLEAPASDLYTGSYHRAARHAADTIATPGTRIMILSAWYGLVDLSDELMPYDLRLGQRRAITPDGLREQAEQLGLRDTPDVVVLASTAYTTLTRHVWPHARSPLAGTCGIGDQMTRLTTLATGHTTLTDLTNPDPTETPAPAGACDPVPGQCLIGGRGGRVHLATRRRSAPPGTLTPACTTRQTTTGWLATAAPLTCPRCTRIRLRRRAVDRWCAMIHQLPGPNPPAQQHDAAPPGQPAHDRGHPTPTRHPRYPPQPSPPPSRSRSPHDRRPTRPRHPSATTTQWAHRDRRPPSPRARGRRPPDSHAPD